MYIKGNQPGTSNFGGTWSVASTGLSVINYLHSNVTLMTFLNFGTSDEMLVLPATE